MSQPAGKCIFCGNVDLTKSHIWPAWAQQVIPAASREYEITSGMFRTYSPNNAVEPESRKVKAGSLPNRRPRNTCFDCNSGWMEKIEMYAQPYIKGLLLGERRLLGPVQQYAIATFLCLVVTRIDVASKTNGTSSEDHQHLMQRREPGPNWHIWIARYEEGDGNGYEYLHFPMQLKQFLPSQQASLTAADFTGRREDANTQVTTICIGRLFAHAYSSWVERDFPGYRDARIARVWPITGLYIDTRDLPAMNESKAIWLHETIGRTRNPPAFK